MKIFYNKTFTGHYPVGTSAIVIADDSMIAAKLLSDELSKQGLSQAIEPASMVRIINISLRSNKEQVIILNDGNY